jgi:hypothetical protein
MPRSQEDIDRFEQFKREAWEDWQPPPIRPSIAEFLAAQSGLPAAEQPALERHSIHGDNSASERPSAPFQIGRGHEMAFVHYHSFGHCFRSLGLVGAFQGSGMRGGSLCAPSRASHGVPKQVRGSPGFSALAGSGVSV